MVGGQNSFHPHDQALRKIALISNDRDESSLPTGTLRASCRHRADRSKAKTRRLRAGSMTPHRRSDTRKLMRNFRLSGPCLSKVVLAVALLGATNCEKNVEPENKSAPSAAVAATMEVPTAQPPKLNDQPVLAPPSLAAPEASPTAQGTPSKDAKAAPAAPSAAAAATTAPVVTAPATATVNPKVPPTTTGARPNPTSPGPMAPRTADTM